MNVEVEVRNALVARINDSEFSLRRFSVLKHLRSLCCGTDWQN